jgi:muramidase (phage lysozyme)
MSPGPYFSPEPDPETIGTFGGYRPPTSPPPDSSRQAQPLPMPPTRRPLHPQDDLSVSTTDLTPEQRRARYEKFLQHPNAQAFLSTIADAEGATYDSLSGDLPDKRKNFTDYSRFPSAGPASGRYQILKGTYGDASKALGLSDFSPHTQDLMAMYLIDQKGALEPLLRGDLDAVLPRVAPVWASLPQGKGVLDVNRYRGQPYKRYDDVRSIYDLNWWPPQDLP